MSELTERLGQIKEQEERSQTRMIQDLILKLQMDKLKMQLSESKIRQQIEEVSRTEAGAAREQWAGFPEEKKMALLRRGTGERFGPGQRRLIASEVAPGRPNIAEMIMEASKSLTPGEQWEEGLEPEQAGQWGMFQEMPAKIKERPEIYSPLAEVMGLPKIAPEVAEPPEAEPKVWIDSSGRLVQKTDVEYQRAMDAGEVLTDNVKGYTGTIGYYNDFLLKMDSIKDRKKLAESWGYRGKNLEVLLGNPAFLRQMAIKQAMEDYGQGGGEPSGYGKYDLNR